MPRFMIPAVFACLLALLIAAPGASAQSTDAIIKDCSDDSKLSKKYSPSALRKARNNIPDDADEYTDCRDVLNRAISSIGNPSNGGGNDNGGDTTGSTGSSGNQSGGDDSGGSSDPSAGADEPLTPQDDTERSALKQAEDAASGPVQVGQEKITPGSSSLATQAGRNGIPTPLVVVLALLGAAALVGSVPIARRQLAAAGPALLRLLRRR